MKLIITLITVFLFQSIHAQSDTNNVLFDSVLLTNGSIGNFQILEVKKKKVVYSTCSEGCAVHRRKLKRNRIDTIIFNSKKIKDPTKYLEVQKKNRMQAIYQGKKVLIKIDTCKYRGVLGIINDSTISVDNKQFSLSEIDMIAKPKTGKTIGLAIASLPIQLTGIIMIDVADFAGEYLYATGPALIGGSITAVIMESRTGKRYPKYKKKKDGTIKQKWSYAIKSP